MIEPKFQHVLTLAYLLSKGARNNFVAVTTTELGRHIGRSQQAASKHLLELEGSGFIERMIDGRNVSVRISENGYAEMVKLSALLQKSLSSSPSEVALDGRLVSGMGEGAYYMSLGGYTEQFRSKIGYVPFPGTLNVKLDRKTDQKAVRLFEGLDGIKIDGFSDGTRTYGWVKCFSGTINDSIECELVLLERTHHDDTIIELISKVCIRDAGKMGDGDRVALKIRLSGQDATA